MVVNTVKGFDASPPPSSPSFKFCRSALLIHYIASTIARTEMASDEQVKHVTRKLKQWIENDRKVVGDILAETRKLANGEALSCYR